MTPKVLPDCNCYECNISISWCPGCGYYLCKAHLTYHPCKELQKIEVSP